MAQSTTSTTEVDVTHNYDTLRTSLLHILRLYLASVKSIWSFYFSKCWRVPSWLEYCQEAWVVNLLA